MAIDETYWSDRFLAMCMDCLPDDEDTTWLDLTASRDIVPADDGPPDWDLPLLVRKFRAAGISDYEMARFAKILCHDSLRTVLYTLDDMLSDDRGPAPDPEQHWGLAIYRTDAVTDEQSFVAPLPVHEGDLLGFDPAGRRMST